MTLTEIIERLETLRLDAQNDTEKCLFEDESQIDQQFVVFKLREVVDTLYGIRDAHFKIISNNINP